ncbi:hypothetical protein DEA8626_01140 [Defluviimonas aquaemixtae]|uniref:Uncharacterized protein n=1 Tax=Albidovulum aquaemixtae TaxID=1542388 RepID=A0A2R8B4R3_9RHOB|nr:hypothetical protein [Defluviimonas aquaemixtae]SPH17616.1 hypothetical protein DEA8626_01140 [Defluviimonas aquaemixtae]
MTTGNAVEGPKDQSMVDQAVGLLGALIAEIDAAMERLKRNQFDELKEATRSCRDLRQALLMVFEERAKVAKLDKLEAGVAYDYALDLDAARDEIGRRLARLRDAGDGG